MICWVLELGGVVVQRSLRSAGPFGFAQGRLRGRLSPHFPEAAVPTLFTSSANFGVGLALGVLVTNVHCSGGGAVL